MHTYCPVFQKLCNFSKITELGSGGAGLGSLASCSTLWIVLWALLPLCKGRRCSWVKRDWAVAAVFGGRNPMCRTGGSVCSPLFPWSSSQSFSKPAESWSFPCRVIPFRAQQLPWLPRSWNSLDLGLLPSLAPVMGKPLHRFPLLLVPSALLSQCCLSSAFDFCRFK